MRILGIFHCGKEKQEAFKRRGNLYDVLCGRDYLERVVSSFDNHIQLEYYGGNMSVSIETIDLEHFSASHHSIPLLASDHVTCQEVFWSDNSKQDVATTSGHSKWIIELLQNITVFFFGTSTIWENTDGFSEQYHCTTTIYLLSMLAHAYEIMVYRGVGVPGRWREIIDGLNDTDKRCL